ncbi:MAG: hypothetical protein HC915_15795 [Anaerolineae bacterium]|nr:hypothetical protein [Anaerolineae bacterium]
MDNLQTARMIEWLDEERRRDKATMAQLQERLQLQQEQIEQLNRQLHGVENEQSSMRTQFITRNREQELVDLIRKDLDQTVEALEAKRLTAEREQERRNEVAREAILQPLRQLETRVDGAQESIKELQGIRAQHDRLMSAMAALQQRTDEVAKKIEEPERRIIFLEEQRRQDARRLSDVQSSLPELQKNIDQLKPRLDLLEGLTRGNERRLIDLQNAETARRAEIQQFLDQQILEGQQREQQVTELVRRVGIYDEDMRRNMERFESWAETHRTMKKIVDDFERIGDRLERRINEVAEMQRLAEERFRAEWNDWQSDDQVRWKEFTVSHDESWRIHDRELQELRKLLRETNESMSPLRHSVERVWKLQRAQAELYRDRYQALLVEYDRPQEVLSSSNGLSANGESEPHR